MGPSLPPRSSVASGFWFKALRLSGKAVLGPQEQAADGGRSEFLTMGEPLETWVGKQCGEGLPSSQLLASYIEKVGPAASGARRLFPLLATALLPLFLLVMYVLICPAYNWEDNSNCLSEELPMPLTAMPERAPANMPHQPKALGQELSVWLDLRHYHCGLLPCQCVYFSILRWPHVNLLCSRGWCEL